MPLYVPPVSRRRFLVQAGAAVGLLSVRSAWAAPPDADPHQFALLADTHVPSDPETAAHGTNMAANLRHVVAELVAEHPRPAAVLVNGDCAYLAGLPDDYALLARLVEPLRQAGLPLHLTMGNHDDRQPMYEALADQRRADPPVAARHVMLLESPRANWFLLDSLWQVNVVTGELGAEQLDWLEGALNSYRDKPAILVAHHNPQFEPREGGTPWTGLRDSRALFDRLARLPHVKAYVYGHTHDWRLDRWEHIHLINLPPVAYVFREGRPNGWVRARLEPDGIRLELSTIDKRHADHGQVVELAWQ